MDIVVKTNYEECAIKLVIHTLEPVKMQVEVFNPTKPKTYYTKRFKTINGTKYTIEKPTFLIRLPQTPEVVIIRVYNLAKGNMPSDKDLSFRVEDVKKIELPKKLNVFDFRNRAIKSFVRFAQEFSENAGILSVPSTYFSDDGNYRIDYLPQIIGDNDKALTTSLRISIITGRIEVNKKRFIEYTVPMRMMILLHEFAHFYQNKDSRNEYEADFNALLIYLGLGYPRIEAHQAWLEVFENTPTEGNKNRYEKIEQFIKNFEKHNFKMVYEE